MDTYDNLVATRGIHLEALGLQDVALTRDDTLRAIELLRAASIPILGGDVYFRSHEGITPAYSNWHTDREGEEKLSAYADRSHIETRRYVEGFPVKANVEPLFVLVIQSASSG